VISKENIIIRAALTRILGSDKEFSEEFKINKLFSSDFYVHKAKLVIEING